MSAQQAPKGFWPWQRGEMHPPEGVVLRYGDEEVPVEVVWQSWEGASRVQNYEVVLPERNDLPTAFKAARVPGKTGVIFPIGVPRRRQQ